MMRSVESILAAIEHLPAVRVDIDDAHRHADVRVGARLVAGIDLEFGGVLVRVPADTIPTLQRVYPSSRPARNGILFDASASQGSSEALAAIHRRVEVERLAPQFRVASP